VGTSFFPVTNAFNVKKTINEEDPGCFGTIYGHTHYAYTWTWNPVNFAKVDAGVKKTYSTINGFYILTGLPLDQTYTVTASKLGHYNKTHVITLTKDNPVVKQYFDLQPKDENVKTLKFGLIHGDTRWADGWTCGPLKFTSIVARGENYYRTKLSGFFGIYFLFVPLDKQISITAGKIGHETETKRIILTEKNRIEYVGFMLNVL
jgi:hypothetical protein